MTTRVQSRHRGRAAAVLLICGSAVAVAAWVHGDEALALSLVGLYVVAALVAYAWSGGEGDVAAIMRVGGDERQRAIDRDATAIAGLVMSVVALAGAIIETARNGDPGAYGVMCAVGGLTYAVSLIAVRHRR